MQEASVQHTASRPVGDRWLRRLSVAMLVLLLAQFLLGMLLNFFFTAPDQHPGSNAPEYFSGVAQVVWWALGKDGLELASHAGLGVILGLLSVALLVMGIRARRRVWMLTTVLGWIGVFAAGFNGASFLNYGHDFSSLLMTIGFLLALISYALGIYVTKPTSTSAA
jgi:hypothetical protein